MQPGHCRSPRNVCDFVVRGTCRRGEDTAVTGDPGCPAASGRVEVEIPDVSVDGVTVRESGSDGAYEPIPVSDCSVGVLAARAPLISQGETPNERSTVTNESAVPRSAPPPTSLTRHSPCGIRRCQCKHVRAVIKLQ